MFTRHIPRHASCYDEYVIYFFEGEDTGRVPNPYPNMTLGRSEAREKYGWVGTARRYDGDRGGTKRGWSIFGDLPIPEYELPYETPPVEVEEDVIARFVAQRMGV